jgi:hypothetical protein
MYATHNPCLPPQKVSNIYQKAVASMVDFMIVRSAKFSNPDPPSGDMEHLWVQ